MGLEGRWSVDFPYRTPRRESGLILSPVASGSSAPTTGGTRGCPVDTGSPSGAHDTLPPLVVESRRQTLGRFLESGQRSLGESPGFLCLLHETGGGFTHEKASLGGIETTVKHDDGQSPG